MKLITYDSSTIIQPRPCRISSRNNENSCPIICKVHILANGDDTTLTFGYQGKAGVSYEMGEVTDIFVEGVLQKTKLFSVTNDIYNPLTMYSGRLGLRYKF